MENLKANNTKAEVKQVGRFGIVGIINTVIDIGLYNVLFSLANLPVIAANLISTSAAVAFSFVANKSFVFRSSEKRSLKQALTFLTVTLFSAYLIQSGVIHFFTKIWPAPFELAHDITDSLGLDFLTREFVVNNGAKALAIGFGMVWNYLWYKKVVFKK